MALASNLDVGNTVSDMIWGYRSTVHRSIHTTPFELMRGRFPNTKLVPAWLNAMINKSELVSSKQSDEREAELKRTTLVSKRVEPRDMVKVRTGRYVKGFSKYQGPFLIKKSLGTM